MGVRKFIWELAHKEIAVLSYSRALQETYPSVTGFFILFKISGRGNQISSPANFTFHPSTVAKIISMSFQKL